MPQKVKNGKLDLIVTVKSIRETELLRKSGLEGKEQTKLRDRYDRILEKMEGQGNGASPGVLVTIDDRETSRFQSRLASDAIAGTALRSGGLEAKFGTGGKGGDWWGWMKSVLDWVDREEAHSILRPTSSQPDDFPDTVKIAMLADWGTGLYGAPISSRTIASKGRYDLLLHLGDVYYSGTEDEVKSRFLNVWPTAAGNVSRALNSNHEMYSGGFGYFKHTLPAFRQTSSYFAFHNQHWVLICLDTAYVDHDLDEEQKRWLDAVVKGAGQRKIILFSHHQPYSSLSTQGSKLQDAVSGLLNSKRIVAWYWGHEHECIVYNKHSRYGLLGRCLGNGGVPEPRKAEVRDAKTDLVVGNVSWKRLSETADSPSSIVLDGSNPYVAGEEDKFGPHGFMTLEMDGPRLVEQVFLPDGSSIFQNQVA